jgi:hypothetical protein
VIVQGIRDSGLTSSMGRDLPDATQWLPNSRLNSAVKHQALLVCSGFYGEYSIRRSLPPARSLGLY